MGTGSDKARRVSDADVFGGGAAGGGSGGGADAAANSGIVRACDQCRIRKIRCDKESPCSNCRIANRQCSSTGAGQKPREARQRVLISTQYERKIDQIEERLGSIEQLLRDLVNTNSLHRHSDFTLPLHNQHPPTAPLGPSDTSTGIHHHHHHRGAGTRSPSNMTPTTTTTGRRDANDQDDDDDDDDDDGSSTPGAATNDLDSSAFEGNSSLTAHTVFASEFLEHAVERTSLRDLNPNMSAALTSLKQIVGLSQQQRARTRRGSGASSSTSTTTTTAANTIGGGGGGSTREVRFAHQRVLPRGGFRELPMPPVAAVIPVLREVKETPPGTFTLISVCCFMAVENFAEACRRVYFALDDFSQATFIIVNAGLYYLFQEKAVTAGSEALAREYTAYHELCRANLETALAHLRFFLGASMETIEALLLGASYAIEVSRPSLAWQLNTTAAQLCQDLGYHRVTGGTVRGDGDEEEGEGEGRGDSATKTTTTTVRLSGDKKAILFWFSYMLDRGLALRLGRAPVIQDFDVTLPRVIGRVNATDMWKEVLRLWIAHSDIQGRIYERLYSPSSLSHPVAQRVEAAQELAARLKLIAEQAGALRSAEMMGRRRRFAKHGESGGWADARKAMVTEMVMKSDQVSFLSSLTLVYRAIPAAAVAGVGGGGAAGGFHGTPSTFTQECIDTARLAMQTHEECMKLMGSNLWVAASYIHWTILYAPFVPFIVLFCHIIETSNMADLHRLRDFIDSLQPTCAVSEGIEKLHRLFSVLYNVAMLYVEAKSKAQQQDTDMAPIGNEFDVYLSALGFMPVDDPASLGPAGTGAGGGAGAMATSPTSGVAVGGGDGGRFNAAANAMAVHQTNQLGDWFSGNRYMMGLLEEDLSQFHPNNWNSGV